MFALRRRLAENPPEGRSPGWVARRGGALAALLAFFLIAVGAPAPARAAVSSGLEGLGQKVDDSELSQMRGKFITPEAVSYFGIQMTSSWQGADGITTIANLLFRVDFAGNGLAGATPQILVSWSREGDPAMDLGEFSDAASGGYVAIVGGAPVSLGALDHVQGAAQGTVIAGADNVARNVMTIAVIPASSVDHTLPAGMTPLDGSATQVFADGDSIRFSVDSGGVGVALGSGQGRDQVAQRIDSTLGQAAQHILLESSHNVALNTASMTVGVDTLRQLDTVRVDNAIAAMKGIGF